MTNSAEQSRMVTALEMSGGYLVLQRFEPQEQFSTPAAGADLKVAMIVDGETTGRNVEVDDLIELGYVLVQVDVKHGALIRVVSRYQGFEEPRGPVPDFVMKLTGITAPQLKGQRFDENRVNADLARTDLVIAHNASFDRGFLERRFPGFRDKWFACSMRDVDWMRYGSSSTKLEFLAFKVSRLFYDAHRALTDAQLLAHVLAQPMDDGIQPVEELLARSRRPWYRVWADGAPLDRRLALREAGYEFSGTDKGYDVEKTWFKETQDLDGELAWLEGNVLPAGAKVRVDTLTGRERFTTRFKRRETRSVAASAQQAQGTPQEAPKAATAATPRQRLPL